VEVRRLLDDRLSLWLAAAAYLAVLALMVWKPRGGRRGYETLTVRWRTLSSPIVFMSPMLG
jgi:hypothetical protein